MQSLLKPATRLGNIDDGYDGWLLERLMYAVMLVLLVLLNFVIAIMGDAFVQVEESAVVEGLSACIVYAVVRPNALCIGRGLVRRRYALSIFNKFVFLCISSFSFQRFSQRL